MTAAVGSGSAKPCAARAILRAVASESRSRGRGTEGILAVMSFVLRDARAGDGRRLEEIRVAGWHAAYAAILDPGWLAGLAVTDERVAGWEDRLATPTPGAVTLVGVDDGVVTGLAALVTSRDDDLPDAAELAALYVEPSLRGTGRGSALLTAGFARMPQPLQTLWVLAGNDPARAFYEQHRFTPDGGSKTLDVPGRPAELRYCRPRLA
ncbi:MAG: hypothetical protein NVS3B26_00280 [Mycobacteriales bacterium]